jgi:hypothetical protein
VLSGELSDFAFKGAQEMKRGLAVWWVVMSSAFCTACGSDEDVYCCALEKIASNCSEGTLKQIADSDNAEACKFTLEQNDLDCFNTSLGSSFSEDEAIAACSSE